MGTLVEQFTTNFVVGGLALFAISLGFFGIHYLNRRRQMLHQERMASLIKGLHYAGVAQDVFRKPTRDTRDHYLSGMRWLFGGAGVSTAMYGYQSMQPVADIGSAIGSALLGLIPGAIGFAHLLFGFLCRKRTASPIGAGAGVGPVYRVRAVGRRF
jgi:hypothetical protein